MMMFWNARYRLGGPIFVWMASATAAGSGGVTPPTTYDDYIIRARRRGRR